MEILKVISVLRSKSVRYLLFRSRYELERKCGLLALRFPVKPAHIRLLSLADWKKEKSRYLYDSREGIEVPQNPSSALREAVSRIENGEIRFFSDKWYYLGLDYDWVTNPLTGYRYDVRQHWTRINDFSLEAGDIKFVWEASRFCWLYPIVRNDYHNNEDHSGFVFRRILDWIEKNPLNCGPNYKCSQEISIRVLNWLLALYFYKYSRHLTEDVWDRIIASVYSQVQHIYDNIQFSRIAVRNNHAVTETLTLYLAGLLFPSFPYAAKWKKNGKRWFEKEIAYQFETDGSYIQNSMNYQRVVTQLLSLGISLAHRNGERFSNVVYDRAYANVNFLYQFQDDRTGSLPNYGNNDGALFFQFSSADYCDYRPQLDALYHILMGQALYGDRLEDSFWYNTSLGMDYPLVVKRKGMVAFDKGGYFLLRDDDCALFVRCGKFKSICTPDQLHVDLWKGGENLLLDAGSYLYNTDEALIRFFSGTEGHNTIMAGEYDQMRKGVRFVWMDPSDILSVQTSEDQNAYTFVFVVKSWKYLDGGYTVKRIIRKKKNAQELTVTDEVAPDLPVPLRQIWHTRTPDKLSFRSNGTKREKEGHCSNYYGRQEPAVQVEFVTDSSSITTTISLL